MGKSKAGQSTRRVLERLRSNETPATLAADLGVRDTEVAAARELVRHIGEHQALAAGQLPDALAQAVVEAAVQIEHADFLKAVAEQGAKGAASAAKRGLAILRSKGIEVEVEERGEAVFKADVQRPDDLMCFLSTCDGTGERALWVPRAIRGGLQLTTALLSDTAGLLQVVSDEVSKRSFKRLREELIERAGPHGITLLEIPPARARGYLALARAMTPRGLTIDQEAQLTGLTGDPKDAVSPARALPALPAEQEAQRLAESDRLLEEKESKSWIPSLDATQKFAAKCSELKAKKELAEDALRQQLEAEGAQAAESYFDAACRERYAGRLFELVEALGATQRTEAAERAGACARALLAGVATKQIPFCLQLFRKVAAKAK